MPTKTTESTKFKDTMRPEYDMTGGVRGKYCQAYRAGHTVKIHNKDGSTTIREFVVQDSAVVLDPDVRAYFQDAEKRSTR